MSTQTDSASSPNKSQETARRLNRLAHKVAKNWLLIFNIMLGTFVLLPVAAPIFMYLGLETAGETIHVIYMAFCHQFPQRSYFFFGPQLMYSIDEVAEVWPYTDNPLMLRQFIGSAEMGWKMAWSDRMVSMYGSMWVMGLAFTFFRHRLNPLPWWGMVLLAIPMGIDGTTHAISDLFGLEDSFRYYNGWLADLTNHVFAPSFYAGNDIGSFNWWMRLITGILFGVGCIWLAYPHFERGFYETRREIEIKFEHAGVEL